jgi:hypothetical protein
MAWHSILYNALLLTCVPYALVRGGAPERWCAAISLVATILSIVALSRSAVIYQDAELGTLAVDVATFAAFFVLALFADRFWTLIVAGLQADAVLIHICKVIQPDILPLGYAVGLSIWSYPILILMAIGTGRHRRRLAIHASDAAWSSSTLRLGSSGRLGSPGTRATAEGAHIFGSSMQGDRPKTTKTMQNTSNRGL